MGVPVDVSPFTCIVRMTSACVSRELNIGAALSLMLCSCRKVVPLVLVVKSATKPMKCGRTAKGDAKVCQGMCARAHVKCNEKGIVRVT